MLSAIPDLSAQEKTNSSALCKRDRNNNKTTVVVVVAISHYSIYIPLFIIHDTLHVYVTESLSGVRNFKIYVTFFVKFNSSKCFKNTIIHRIY